jgi:hypothetical protein
MSDTGHWRESLFFFLKKKEGNLRKTVIVIDYTLNVWSITSIKSCFHSLISDKKRGFWI